MLGIKVLWLRMLYSGTLIFFICCVIKSFSSSALFFYIVIYFLKHDELICCDILFCRKSIKSYIPKISEIIIYHVNGICYKFNFILNRTVYFLLY